MFRYRISWLFDHFDFDTAVHVVTQFLWHELCHTYPQFFEHNIHISLYYSVGQISDKCSVWGFVWQGSFTPTAISTATATASASITTAIRVAFPENESIKCSFNRI